MQPPADQCGNLRFLMRANTTPGELLAGGGALVSGRPTGGAVEAEDIGDVWSFVVEGAINNTTAEVVFSDVPGDMPLEFAVFQGMNRITQNMRYEPVIPAQSYTIPTPRSGIYTIVVRLQNFTQSGTLAQPVSYQIRVNYQGSDDVAAGLTTLRDEQTRQEFTAGRDFRYEAGRQMVSFPSGSTFSVNPGSLRAVATRQDAAGQVIFSGDGSLLLDNWATSVSLVGGGLSVLGAVDDSPRLFYLENFGSTEQLISPTQSALREIFDSNGTLIGTDWQGVSGIWMLMDCMGYKLVNGTTVVIPITPTSPQRSLTVRGGGTSSPACDGLLMRATAPTPAGNSSEHSICFPPESVEPGTTILLDRSVLDAQLIENRQISLQSTDIRMAAREGEDGSSFPLNITLADQDVSLALDWTNLARLTYVDSLLEFTFLDTPRTSTTRDGTNLLSLDAVDDVIHIVYKGEDAQERLLLPADENYAELITPRGEPTFGGLAFSGTALPGEPGYQPRALNNLGGECYPVNTVLEIANCAPNGDVNPANGNLWYSVVDHVAYHPVFDLTQTRSYNSAVYTQDGAFGFGWTMDFPVDYAIPFDPMVNARVLDLADADPETRVRYRAGLDVTWAPRGVVTLTTPSGSLHTFVRQRSSGGMEAYSAITMPGWTLTRAGGSPVELVRSRWTLRLPDGLTYEYDRAGRLRAVGYPEQGHRITVTYPSDTVPDGTGVTGDGAPVIISDDADARQLELYYDSDYHIVRSVLRDLTVADANSDDCLAEQSCFETTYEYTNGLLTRVTYPGGQVATYSYDGVGRLIRHDDPQAPVAPIMGYVYANEVGGAIAEAYVLQADEAAPNDDSYRWRRLSVTEEDDERRVLVTDELGNQTIYTYDLSSGDLREAGASYTLFSTLSPLADADAFEAIPTTYTWDDGLLVARPFRALPTIAGRGRNSVEYGYTADGMLSWVRGGYPGFSMATINAAPGLPELPTTLTFADGASAAYGDYNADGFFNSYTDRSGVHYRFERDSRNRPLRITRTNDGVIWEYSYDDSRQSGFVSSIRQINTLQDPGYTVGYRWDGLGRLVAVSDSILGEYQIAYLPVLADEAGNLYSEIVVTAPGGSVTRSRFDGSGRLIETRLQQSADSMAYLSRATYEYDVFGRLTAEVRWLLEGETEQAARTTYSYTPEPDLTQVGERTRIGGTRVTQTDPIGRTTFIVYDALGRVRLRGSGQSASRFDYDVSDPQNPSPNPTVNQNGLSILQRDFLGGTEIARTTYVFDSGWQLTSVRRTEGSPIDNPGAWTGEWRLFNETVGEVDQRLRFLQAPLLGLEDVNWSGSYERGRAGALNILQDTPLSDQPVAGGNMNVDYDFLGRPTQVVQTPDGAPVVTMLVYCPQPTGGLRIVRSNLNQSVNCETEDAALVLVYDAHNRLVSVSDASGVRTFTYTLDAATGGTAVQMITSGDVLFSWTLKYDAAGNLTEWTDENGVIHSYSYDTLGRLRAVTVPDMPEASYSFEYNLADLVTEQTDGLGRGTRYAYNTLGQVALEQDVLTGDASSYIYDNRGLLLSATSPLGTVTTYEYNDPVDPTRITAITTATARDEFIWNDSAHTLTHVDPVGRRLTYTFDSLGLLGQMNSPAERLYTLVHDRMGRLTGWLISGESERALSLDYEAEENRLRVGEAMTPGWNWEFGFTSFGQLSSVTNPAGQNLTFAYDPLNRLANVIANGEPLWTATYTDQSPQVSLLDGQILTYDALYRLVRSQNGDATTDIVYAASEDEGVLNLQIETATGIQIYTFSPGDDRQPPRIAHRMPGRRSLFTYDAEGWLESIDREVCLQAPYFDLTSTPLASFTIEDQSVCASDDVSVWRSNVRITYDELGQPIRVVDAEQGVETFTYDGAGSLVSYQDQDGRTYNYAYDALNRLTRLSAPVGVELSLTYDLDQVSGICRASSSANYDACLARGDVLETYAYDALGRLVEQRFPNGDSTTSVEQQYGLSGGGALTVWGANVFTYADDGLSTLAQVNDDELTLTSDNLTLGTLRFIRDALGRLSEIHAGEQALLIEYDQDNLGYRLVDETSGVSLRFRLYANGLLESVEASSQGEDTPVLSVAYFAQEANGILPFTVNWNDDYLLDLRANRRGEELFIDHVPAFTGSLTADYVFSPRGNILRAVIASDDPAYFETGGGGYTIVFGYDQGDRPLTMRVTGINGGLLYQATFVYDIDGQLITEVREYADGTRVQIDYQYGNGSQLTSRTVSVMPGEPSANAGLGMLALGVLGGVGALRFTQGRRRQALALAGLSLSLSLVFTTIQAQDASPVVYTYAYDEQGNLTRVVANDETCLIYSYDDSNRLVLVETDESVTEYGYDLYNRVISVNDTQLVYLGTSRIPVVLVNGEGAQFYAVTEDGMQLFRAANGDVTPFVYGGWGQALGMRSSGDDSAAATPIWLFDPYRRFLSLTPQPGDNPCALSQPAADASLLPFAADALWDTQNNLLFEDGRAYAPELARFLQRDPLGPDALGRVYQYAPERASAPVRPREPVYVPGIRKLSAALATQQFSAGLSADSVASLYLPQPNGMVTSEFYDQLQRTPSAYRETLGELISLPSWLASSYNLPGARIDPSSGALRLLTDNAPGQGGWGDPLALDFSSPIWSEQVWAQDHIAAPQATLAALVERMQLPANRLTTYQATAWRADTLTLSDTWYVPAVDLGIERTPAAVLDYLPRPLTGYGAAVSMASLAQTLDALPQMTSRDWLDLTLEAALPDQPVVPPATLDEWRQEWFREDTFGIAGTLSQRYLLPRPPELPLDVTVQVGEE